MLLGEIQRYGDPSVDKGEARAKDKRREIELQYKKL